MLRNEGFANFGYFYRVLPKSHFFYTVEVCGNGYWRNGVTTSLFMTFPCTITKSNSIQSVPSTWVSDYFFFGL